MKDFLLHRLTGRFATTFDCAHLTWLFDARPQKKRWSAELRRQVGIVLQENVLFSRSVRENITPQYSHG